MKIFIFGILFLWKLSPLQADLKEIDAPQMSSPTALSREVVSSTKSVSAPAEHSKDVGKPRPVPSPPPKKSKKTSIPLELNASSSPPATVQFEGEGLVGSRQQGFLELTRHVKVTRGELSLKADRAKLTFEPQTEEIQKILATGHVLMERASDDPKERIRAQSEEALFESKQERVTLTGQAVLTKGSDEVKGHTILYELKTGQVVAQQVKGVLHPEKPVSSSPSLPRSP